MSCGSVNLDLCVSVGTTPPPVVVTCTDSVGDPFDLTGSTLAALVKDANGVEVLDLVPIVTDFSGGVITMAPTDEQTASMTAGAKLTWDLIIELSDGRILPPAVYGKVRVTDTTTL